MDVTEIINEVNRLPSGKRLVLAYKIFGGIDRIERTELASERYRKVLAKTEEVTGMKNTPGKRDADSVFVRTISVWRMLDEGYTHTDIGKAIGKDHATVTYIAKLRKTALEIPMAYREHLAMYGKLNLALNNDD